uniref:Uncharacterized protein n=2 Tax=Amphimedon queenslandica TaxID=400682 RepID=A0A1X7SP63_AMPQE
MIIVTLCCASDPNGYYLLGGSGGHGQGEGAELTLWDRRVLSKGPLKEMVGHKGSVNGCLFLDNDSSNDKLVASCSSDSTVKIWSTTTGGSVLSEYIGGGAGPISGIVSPSPETLAASTFNEGVYVWKLVSDSSMELKLRAKY